MVAADVTGWGLLCGLGDDPFAVARRVDAGETALRADEDLRYLPGALLARVAEVPTERWLKRRKDIKLLARPARLLLPAAGEALGDCPADRLDVGLYLGVGQEPPDEGDSEASLAASARGGRLDPDLLAGPGRALYPPLLPLRTLPNMALAHVSIHLDLGGDNGTFAGEVEAGLHAARAAVLALGEGRCPLALAGGSDSLADPGNARDLRRRGITAHPGEAAAVLRLSPPGSPGGRCRVTALPPGALADHELDRARQRAVAHRAALGWCGAADGALALILACARVAQGAGPLHLAAGDPAIVLRVGACD